MASFKHLLISESYRIVELVRLFFGYMEYSSVMTAKKHVLSSLEGQPLPSVPDVVEEGFLMQWKQW